MSSTNTKPAFFQILLDELRPVEGRLAAALRMSLCCVLVVAFAMSQHVPEAAVSCYLIFFASRDNSASGILIAMALIVGASIGILLGLVFLQLAADEPMLRLALMAIFTFGGMYFSVATKAGPIAATIGFVFAFVMTLNDFVPVPELLSRGLSWMWVVVFIPMAVLILVNALMGPNPAKLVRQRVSNRLHMAAALLRGEANADEDARRLLKEDVGALLAPARLGAIFGYHSKSAAAKLTALMPMAQQVLVGARAATHDRLLAQNLATLADCIKTDRLPPPALRASCLASANAPLAGQTARMLDIWSGRVQPLPKDKQVPAPADIFSNPAYGQFALKTLLAVLITYTIYTAGGWFEIHTAMITCFYVALGTTGETLHKAGLRLVGCLIGAAMGIGSIAFLMPHMTDIGHLLLLVAAGSFLAAWVAQGSSLTQYMGWQMALAFFLCVLQGYGPSLDIDVATNRLLGILIGNVVVTVVFLWLWPTSIATQTANHLSRALDGMQTALLSGLSGSAAVMPELSQARRLSQLSAFEPARLRMRSPLLPHTETILSAAEAADRQVTRLSMLQQKPRYLFGAPLCVKTASFDQQASVAGFLEVASSSTLQPDSEARNALRQALKRSEKSLARLEALLKRSPKRAAWRRDLAETVMAHRALALVFSQALETI